MGGEQAASWSVAFAFAFVPICLIVFVISYMFNEKKAKLMRLSRPLNFILSQAAIQNLLAAYLPRARLIHPRREAIKFYRAARCNSKIQNHLVPRLKISSRRGRARSLSQQMFKSNAAKAAGIGALLGAVHFAPARATASPPPTCREFLISPLLRACRVRHTAAQSRFCNETVFLARRLDKSSLAI